MVARKISSDHSRPKRPRWVERCSGKVNAKELRDEERKAYPDWGHEGRTVLFFCQYTANIGGKDFIRVWDEKDGTTFSTASW
jgi:hypothetical protein